MHSMMRSAAYGAPCPFNLGPLLTCFRKAAKVLLADCLYLCDATQVQEKPLDCQLRTFLVRGLQRWPAQPMAY